MIPVKIINKQGGVMLVEWQNDGRPQRAVVPKEFVAVYENNAGGIDAEILSRCNSVGDDWERFIGAVNATPAGIADALRRAGFWEWRDIERDPQGAQRAINTAVGIMAARLARLAKMEG